MDRKKQNKEFKWMEGRGRRERKNSNIEVPYGPIGKKQYIMFCSHVILIC